MAHVLLQLEHQPSFDEDCATLIDKLKLKSPDYFHIVTTAEEASAVFTGSDHPVVLATDHGLALAKYRKQRSQAARWVGMGGELFFAGQFASLATPEQIKTLFTSFQHPWEAGDVIEAEFAVNENMEGLDSRNNVSY